MSTPTLDIEREYEPQAGDEVIAWIDGAELRCTLGGRAGERWFATPEGSHQRLINPADILRPAGELAPVTEAGAILTADEQARLEECEQVIEKGRQAFIEVGEALIQIQAGGLYRAQFPTFEAYLRDRWDISRPRGYELMTAAKTAGALSAMADTDAVLPETERQLRELGKRGLNDWQRMAAWNLALSRAGGAQPTAKELEQAVDETLNDYLSHTRGEAVWWADEIEGKTILRAGTIQDLKNGSVLINPTDGAGPDLVSKLPDRLGVGKIPGTPNPFGNCTTCETILTGRDRCPACSQKAAEIAALKTQAEEAATRNSHQLGDWHEGEHQRQVAKCKHCPATAGIYAGEVPPASSLSARLRERCEGAPAPTPRPGGDVEPAKPTAQELAALRTELQSRPPRTIAREYAEYRDCLYPDAHQWRTDAYREELDRRRKGGVDDEFTSYCPEHGDYKCKTCEAIARTRAMAEAAGESPDAMVAAAGLATPVPSSTPEPEQPAAPAAEPAKPAEKPGFLKSAVEKAAEKAAAPPAPAPAPALPAGWEGQPVQTIIPAALKAKLTDYNAAVIPALNTYCELASVAKDNDLQPAQLVGYVARFLAYARWKNKPAEDILARYEAVMQAEEE